MSRGPNHQATAMAARMDDPWRHRAVCRGLDRLMDPPPAKAPELEGTALAVCRTCPVTIECLSWVLSLPNTTDPGGVAGGTTERRRKSLRRQIAVTRNRAQTPQQERRTA